jgi:fibro-slime domain-containing protein
MNRFYALTGMTALGLGAAVLSIATLPGQAVAEPMPQDDPEYLQLEGKVRDFIEKTKPGGHPDFENKPSAGFALYNGNISQTLGSDGKPVFVGGGWKTTAQWKDAQGHPICYSLYDPAKGDIKGTKSGVNTGGITNGASFIQWFNDTAGVNLSAPLTIKLVKDSNGSYVFDDKLDSNYASIGGFFPIDGQLYGNSGGSPVHNFHFTFELHCEFTYDQGTGQMFKFIGDDDVFVFINNKLVIDLGGVHSAQEQYVDLDRLGLEDGETYPLDFFYAERHRTQANCRIQTNLVLNSGPIPSVSAAFD